MKEDAKAKVLNAMVAMLDELKSAGTAVSEDKPIDAINSLLIIMETCERLSASMIRIESIDSGKTVQELCECSTCKQAVKEQKERDERKATSPLN